MQEKTLSQLSGEYTFLLGVDVSHSYCQGAGAWNSSPRVLGHGTPALYSVTLSSELLWTLQKQKGEIGLTGSVKPLDGPGIE